MKVKGMVVDISAQFPTGHSLFHARTRTILGDRSFAVAGPRVWNSLLAALRQIGSLGDIVWGFKT